jgi:hypothetical protein
VDGILKSIIDLLTPLGLYSKITVGALPPRNGIAVYIGAGAPQNIFLDKGSYDALYVAVNAKHTDQVIAVRALTNIHRELSTLKTYPQGDFWQITNISTSTVPNYISEEKDGFLWGSILKLDIYYFNKEHKHE